MQIITIDFETYYSPTYSLSKITTEEYVRHAEFETIGVAVKVDDSPTEWFSGTKEETKQFLGKFAWNKAVAVAHNAVFDMSILNWVFDIRPKHIADTLSMARAIHGTEVGGSLKALVQHYELGEKGTEVINALGKRRQDFSPDALAAYAGYCINDVELTYGLFEVLGAGFPLNELKLIDLTIRMFTEPVLELSGGLLERHLVGVQEKKEMLLYSSGLLKEDLMSNARLAMFLESKGVVPPKKISSTTGNETFAFAKTDEAFKELLEHEDALVQAAVAARLGVKSTLEESRTQRLLHISERGPLPVPLRYYAAHTGRWGGDDKVNLQNLPRKSPLKHCIWAPEGYMMIDSDSSQIEARTLAWLAEQNDLVDAFDKGEDVYKIMASAIYNKPVVDITSEERFVGKTTILGAGYGMGSKKFRVQLKTMGVDMSEDECERIISVYRSTYPKIPELWATAGRALRAIIQDQTAPLGLDGVLVVEGTKGVRLPNGLYMKYPNLRHRSDPDTGKDEMVYDTKKGRAVVPNRIYGGKMIENVCQALARIIIGEQMLLIAKRHRVVMTVHDAIACVVPIEEVEKAQKFIEMYMRWRPSWALGLPLNCESGLGLSYGDCK
jgi:DNA polymerase